MAIIKPPTGYQPMQRQRKNFFPFIKGMRGDELVGVGANRAENVWFRNKRITKMKGIERFKEIADIAKIVFLGEYQKPNGDYQIIYCYEASTGVYRFRALTEDGDAITLGTESRTAGAGTVTAVNNSASIIGVGTAFTTFFAVGDTIDGLSDGRMYRVIKIVSNTSLVIDRPFEGGGISGSGYNKVLYPGGVGDVSFGSSEFSFETVLDNGYISNNYATNYLYRWDGTCLAVVDSAPPLIRGLARDGKRLAVITPTGAEFSQDNITTTFRGGTGVAISGIYSTITRQPKSVKTAGVGIVIVGEEGSEAHAVVPNAASDDVNANTRIKGYNDKELGVDMAKKVTFGKSFMWRVTPKGIMRTNPFNGETVNVIRGGKIERYWEVWDTSNASIAYDEANEQVVCAIREGAQNDILVCIDTIAEDMPVSIMPSAYYEYIASINNQIYGGSSRDGSIDKIFLTTTSVTGDNIALKYISEWDELTNLLYWKIFKRLYIAANLSPGSEMTVKLYFDGETEASYTETFTTSDTVTPDISSAPYGMYLFAAGAVDLGEDNSNQSGEIVHTKKFSTVCVEIYENSNNEFEIYDMILEYKTKNKFYHGKTYKNILFN